jgi:hypothetical protein
MVCGWFLLESAKDQFLGVDPPPRITCATMCLVWNNLLTNYDCFMEFALLGGVAMGMAIPMNCMVQGGPRWGNLSNARGASVGKP